MGLVARAIEKVGIPTVTLNMIWAYQILIGMPRLAAIEYPFGRPYGDVGDSSGQRAVLRAALELFDSVKEPGGIVHLPFEWREEPKQTRWHPSEPSPIIAMLNKRRGS